MSCEDTDFQYPMKADIYYPILTQGSFGELEKEWVFDRTVVCNATPFNRRGTEDLKAEMFIQYDNALIARTKSDIRFSSQESGQAITNILVTNVRFGSDVLVYKETAGPRAGKGTIYELATFEPFVGPFASIEYYKMVWRRTESQSVRN